MILRAMLQRLYAALTAGPGLNARPHHSRQRIDVMELRHLQADDPASLLARLFAGRNKPVEITARNHSFRRPEYPEGEWSDEQKLAGAAQDRQGRVLDKLRDIVEDATDYYNDHGEHALFIGFPIISIPPVQDRQGSRTNRVLAPVMLAPINLRVRRGANAGISIELAGEGNELVQPNPALLAWIEQQTGASTESLFSDETGEDPWREIAEMLALVAKAAGIRTPPVFDGSVPLQLVPRTEQLPGTPSVLSSAVLGLFPLANPGLLRDTQWMIEEEPALVNPVKAFLSPAALAEPEPSEPEPPAQFNHTNPAAHRAVNFSEQFFVTHADPCQAEAVAHARCSPALVIHGPPGTGKSQTIANVIGDHLAHGERVLFVCDKRTALDVVKYRLDSMGLGDFCGVIHDPQRDRRAFYLSLRERLENLAEARRLPDPARELAMVNERLNQLHTELRGYFDCLHAVKGPERSFHELCGDWLELRARASIDLPDVEGLTVELLGQHRADAEEILRRGREARWEGSPFRGRIGMSLERCLATTSGVIRKSLEAAARGAAAVDEHSSEDLLPLDTALPLGEQAAARRELASRLNVAAARGLADVAARLAVDVNWSRWRAELAGLRADQGRLSAAIDRELFLQVKDTVPSLTECSRALLAISKWQSVATSWKRFFAGKVRRAAAAVLEPLALDLSPPSLDRAREFYVDLKTRHLWNDLRGRLLGAGAALPPDEILIQFRDGLPELLAVRDAAELPANASAQVYVTAALGNMAEHAQALAGNLQLSAARAEALARLETALAGTGLFTAKAIHDLSARWRSNGPAGPECQRFVEFADTIEHAVRLNDRLQRLAGPLQAALDDAAARGLSWEDAEPALRAAAIAREIRRRLAENEALGRVDTQRVEAAFSELVERTAEKTELVRRLVRHTWQDRWRGRLLSSTGSRLNSDAAALRQRLFVRGQKAMKLRQMIAAGADAAGGDPLFDLCPVWMASPATVAQIFPRAPIFDVIVFDEASQCRLEEALPVLLRGKRVVIAGDPKQLPPTRFFEQALAESDDVSAETAAEVFQQQQSEAEDLLAAALNLNVQESFLDVHYRSRNEALIGFSNQAFYGGRLQPIPGHPARKALQAPIRLVRVDGEYHERGNEAEAKAAAKLVAELLDDKAPPSIGLACFNLNQRDLILKALDDLAAADQAFAKRLDAARQRRGPDSFEGLFVKNLENVQGDERDHMIISTTFGPDAEGRFRRNFGALSRVGGERRLNVLVTRARAMVHVLTSIPRPEYMNPDPLEDGQRPTGRHQLYAYLRYAEQLERQFDAWQRGIETARAGAVARCEVAPTANPSPVAESIARQLLDSAGVGSTVYWGNEGFCVDVALTHPALPADVTVGVLTDFTRYGRTPDPIAWEQFRSVTLASQGWEIHRLWSPALFRDPQAALQDVRARHERAAERPGKGPRASATEERPK